MSRGVSSKARRAATVPRLGWLSALLACAVAAAACGGAQVGVGSRNAAADAYGERSATRVSGDSVTVEMKNLKFAPQGIRVRPGTTVTWVNNDPVAHNVSQIESHFLSQDVMEQGATFSFTVTAPGTYRYQCTFHHPNMNGVVIVEG